MSAPEFTIDKKRTARFTRAILSFYRKEGRAMSWRDTTDPYRILVSEIMLQQTQVDRVREKYREFIGKFPTVDRLADAPLGEALRLWSGLGYNRRAKYLHECAKAVHALGGAFPRTMEELVELPGIGRSTAAGIMAFSWNLPEPMIDTNLRRVLHRVFFKRSKKTDEELYRFAKAIIPKGKGRIWNYAMLDVAATKCTARNHAQDCPLAALHGKIIEAPRKSVERKFLDTDRYARGRVLEALRGSKRGLSVLVLSQNASRDEEKTRSLLEKLLREGLVVKGKTLYKLP